MKTYKIYETGIEIRKLSNIERIKEGDLMTAKSNVKKENTDIKGIVKADYYMINNQTYKHPDFYFYRKFSQS